MPDKIIAIIGATGMLGSGIYKYFKDRPGYKMVLTSRSSEKFAFLYRKYGTATNIEYAMIFDVLAVPTLAHEGQVHNVNTLIAFLRMQDVDLVINCVGVLNKFGLGRVPTAYEYYLINSFLPIELSNAFKEKFIHPSTDCIFDGTAGPYDEDSEPSPSYGIYGHTKWIADDFVKKNSLVLRCCLLGEEISAQAFQLFTWLRKNQDGRVDGYFDWVISPITNLEFARICEFLVDTPRVHHTIFKETGGILHIATGAVDKYNILKLYADMFNLNIHVNFAKNPKGPMNKVLKTQYPHFVELFNLSKLDRMLWNLQSQS